MKYYYIIFLISIISCHQKNTPGAEKVSEIPQLRSTVNKKPVASYIIPMGDPRLDRKFGVDIFETKYTFKYLLEMQYDGMEQEDTLLIPNFDIWPVVKVEPGKEKLSCIIGFMDKKNNFRAYKMLSATNDQLKLTVLQSYAVTEY